MSEDQLSEDIFNSSLVTRLSHSIRILTLKKCSSTQKLLIDWWEKYAFKLDFTPVLHTSYQYDGKGQKNRKWISNQGSLTYSLLLAPHTMPSWTPLEIAVLCRNFISDYCKLDLHLKWPNDLVDHNHKKYGGIICHMRKQMVIVGIGLNLFPVPDSAFNDLQSGFLYSSSQYCQQDTFLKLLLEYLVNNRILNHLEIKMQWLKHCNHLNKTVQISENHHHHEGIFIGLGDFGEALIYDNHNVTHKITNGSLSFN